MRQVAFEQAIEKMRLHLISNCNGFSEVNFFATNNKQQKRERLCDILILINIFDGP